MPNYNQRSNPNNSYTGSYPHKPYKQSSYHSHSQPYQHQPKPNYKNNSYPHQFFDSKKPTTYYSNQVPNNKKSQHNPTDVEQAFLDTIQHCQKQNLNSEQAKSNEVQYFMMQVANEKIASLRWLRFENSYLVFEWLFGKNTLEKPYQKLTSARHIATVIYSLGKLTKNRNSLRSTDISSAAINELINKLIKVHPNSQDIANSFLGLGYLANANLLDTTAIHKTDWKTLSNQLIKANPNSQDITNSIVGLKFLSKANKANLQNKEQTDTSSAQSAFWGSKKRPPEELPEDLRDYCPDSKRIKREETYPSR